MLGFIRTIQLTNLIIMWNKLRLFLIFPCFGIKTPNDEQYGCIWGKNLVASSFYFFGIDQNEKGFLYKVFFLLLTLCQIKPVLQIFSISCPFYQRI